MCYYKYMHKQESLKKQHLKKADIFLIVICLLSALLSGLWFLFGQQTGTVIRISYDGTEMYTIDLKQDHATNGTVSEENTGLYYLITYSGVKGNPEITRMTERSDCPKDTPYNLLCISDGKIRMESADCKDQICVHHKPISGIHESIICLPHKLVIEIVGDLPADIQNENVLDGMVK